MSKFENMEPSVYTPWGCNPINAVDANSRAKYGTPALHIASRRGQAAALGLLLDEGADINAKDDEGITPLIEAIMLQCDEVLDIL
jgi:ankyrin repeat protein